MARTLRLSSILTSALGRAVLLIGLVASPGLAQADDGTIVVQAQPFVTRFVAYAQVQPITILKLRAAVAGIVSGLKVVPGAQVGAGATLAHLKGPTVDTVLAEREAAVVSAKAALAAAQKSLAVQRQNRALQISTTEAVSRAESTLAEAQAHLDSAQSQLQAIRSEATLQSPKARRVLTVSAADGERVGQGQVVLTLEPANDLWLKASFYGADATSIRSGMQGQFQPANGGPAIPVKVRSILGALQLDGGLVVGLAPMVSSPGWQNGESGTVTLEGQKSTLAAVPTRALILDQGHWWVMVHTQHGDRRQAVVPGPSRGDMTLIRQGLAVGSEVVVENPYLEFHRNFSQTYQQPD